MAVTADNKPQIISGEMVNLLVIPAVNKAPNVKVLTERPPIKVEGSSGIIYEAHEINDPELGVTTTVAHSPTTEIGEIRHL